MSGTVRKVLLVDDSATALMMERLLLWGRSYEILTARDGEEAVRVALGQRPDLILMDVEMPKMSGLEALEILRQNEATRDVPIILVAACAQTLERQAAYRTGCTDYLVKPVDRGRLLDKLDRYLGGAQ